MTDAHINPTTETIDFRSLAVALRSAAADDIYYDTSFEDDDTERAAWDERIDRAHRAMRLAALVLDAVAVIDDANVLDAANALLTSGDVLDAAELLRHAPSERD